MSTWKKVLVEDDAVGSSGLALVGNDPTGGNVNIRLSDGTNTDDVLVTAGSNITIDSIGAGGFTINAANDNTQLSEEQVEDFVGGMLGGTETGITVTYQDGTGDIDFVVADQTLQASDPNSDASVVRLTKSNPTTADTVDITAGSNITFSSISAGGFTIDAANDNTQLSEEQVEDFVGGMLGGTETGISVTYQDGTGDIDFVVADQTLQASDPNSDASVVRLTKSNPTTADTVDITAGSNITFSSISAGGFTIAADNDNTQLSEEQVEDFVGGMLGGTETGISVTYQDGTGDIDFVVADTTLQASDPNSDASVVRLTKSNPTTADTVDITAGSNITFSSISASGFTIAADNDDVSNANLLSALSSLESAGGAADQNIVIGTDSGDTIVITGNLQVDGTTTTVNSTTLTVDDKNIVVASGAADAAACNGAGITVDVDGDDNYSVNPEIQWLSSHSNFSEWAMKKGGGESTAFIAAMMEESSFANLNATTPGIGTFGMVGGALYIQTA